MLTRYNSHYRTLLSLGIPIMVGQAGLIVQGFADTMMVGHHSTLELAAASFVNNIFNFVILFGLGFSYGLTPIVGGYCGRGNHDQAGQALRCSLPLNLAVGVLLTGVLSLFYLSIEQMGQPEELLPLIKPYFLVTLASLVPLMVFNAFKQFADGTTDTQTGMWIMLGGNVLNIVGNYLLIYGKAGFPELGLMGAGISTLASRIIMMLAFGLLFLRMPRFAPYHHGFFSSGWSRALMKHISTMGYPIALQMGMESAAFNLSTIMVGWLGSIALASHQIMLTISQFTFMMYYGLGAAVSIRVSHFKGQNNYLYVRQSATAGFHLMIALGLVLSTIVFMLRHELGGWFTADAEVSATVVALIFPLLIYQFGDGLQINYANALRGISDVRPMMLFAFIAFFVISLPLSYLFGIRMQGGVLGIWMSYPFGLTAAGILFWLRFRHRVKRVHAA